MDELEIGMEIKPCETIDNIYNQEEYKKLNFTSSQRIQVEALFQHLPAMAESNILSSAYTVKFPEGVSGTLMSYKKGGEGTPIVGKNGKIVSHASLEKVETQTQMVVFNAFNLMSIVSGQYFLSEINSQLRTLNQGIDKILEFLYSDKKAELMAEVSFAKYAYRNYTSIMSHDEQRVATIGSLQKAKKVAMKDIEFYMSDLSDISNSKGSDDPVELTDKAFRIKSCLELSMQLYVISTLLEIYYSQNCDKDYISFVEEEAVTYLGKCEKRMLGSFGMIANYIHAFKPNLLKKIDKVALENKVTTTMDSFMDGREPEICRSFCDALQGVKRGQEYYVDNDKKVIYLKTA